MIVAVGMPCDAERTRSKLSHGWLGNKVQRLTAKSVATMHANRSPSRANFEERLFSDGLYDNRLRSLKDLTEMVVEGYSPARVVERGPLTQFSEPVQTAIEEVLHEQYLKTPLYEGHCIVELQAELRAATDNFSSALDNFRAVWFQDPSASANDVQTSFQTLLKHASSLREALDHLPRGFVLP